MLPWPFTLIWLAIHFPMVVIRATRWEKVQVLSLVLAVVSFGTAMQAYVSTQMRGDDILVWMPLTLLLDAGAMMQMFWLIVEEAGLEEEERRRGVETSLFEKTKVICYALFGKIYQIPPSKLRQPDVADNGEAIPLRDVEQPRDPGAGQDLGPPAAVVLREDLRSKAIMALLSLILFILLFVLQIFGLVYAIKGHTQTAGMTATWCSPMLQAFVVAIQDGNCNFHAVTSSASKGIGCLSLPATTQIGWLTASAALLSTTLILEGIDMTILALVGSSTRWRGAKMRRPWFTMFAGVILLVVMVTFGVLNASTLPSGITKTIWVFRREPSMGQLSVCKGTLRASGVRGSFIGWLDGFLHNWGEVYFGPT